jgi:diaminohydroxyphosphoribosylaminopyrimidine deaminase/5-amino-6-(5-phosphoribosylamino)uracil reductase
MKNDDMKFMRRALFLARTRTKNTSPNPRVGAVLVKSGRIVGEGATQPFGGPHAEVMALKRAGSKSKGSTLYVTLEPCCHYGKTPPCTEAVIRAGVKRVVAAGEDPFPLVKGRGFRELKKAGLSVQKGLLKKEAEEINHSFIFSAKQRRPWVLLKAALSLDGKFSPPKGRSKWITADQARRKAHEIRSKVDAILVGAKTATADNPSLTVRLPGFKRTDGWPLRVLLDSKLEASRNLKMFQGKQRTVLFTSPGSSLSREKALLKLGIQVFRVPLIKKMLSLKAILRILHSLQVRSLLLEGGGEVHSSFLKEKLVDEVALFISPRLLGEASLPWVGQDGVENLNRIKGLKNPEFKQVGVDFMLTGRL